MTDFKLELSEEVRYEARSDSNNGPGDGATPRLRSIPTMFRWAKERLKLGQPVHCVRGRASGLIITMIANAPGNWLTFDGKPLREFTLTPMSLSPEGELRFGIEREWMP